MKSTLLGRPMVTRSPCFTPTPSSARAMRLVRRSSSAQVTVRYWSLTAGRSGRSFAVSVRCAPMEICCGGCSAMDGSSSKVGPPVRAAVAGSVIGGQGRPAQAGPSPEARGRGRARLGAAAGFLMIAYKSDRNKVHSVDHAGRFHGSVARPGRAPALYRVRPGGRPPGGADRRRRRLADDAAADPLLRHPSVDGGRHRPALRGRDEDGGHIDPRLRQVDRVEDRRPPGIGSLPAT